MTCSGLFAAIIGVVLSFAPAECLARLGVQHNPPLAAFVQLCGALYLGFAILNWMARESTIGGIYNRPLAMGNFMHFTVGALALGKSALAGSLPMTAWVAVGV